MHSLWRAPLALCALLTSYAPAHALLEPSVPVARPRPPSDSGRAALRAFNQLDWSGDGLLQARELAALRARPQQLFLMLDRDGKGGLSRAELPRGAAGEALWRRLDGNRDGRVAAVDLRGLTSLALLDQNGDGAVSPGELRPGLPLTRMAPPQAVRSRPVPPAHADMTNAAKPLCVVPLTGEGGFAVIAPVPTDCITVP